ncbi:MAG: 16S rRNA (cytosine(967)-C(5))-methyltransferase RsmB, partial [Deltaproteobacteria bacterium]|nr:16S rRNA (cytosine(967)-C(5))-methyltransferase RsmB [Deltaproteobacteria bacterium]
PDDLAYFQKMQVALLENAAQILAPDGIIVYSTCSMEPEENEEVLKIFLANQPRIVISGARKWLSEQALPYVNQEGLFHTRPSEDIQDGFFAARLARVSRPEI